MLSTGDMAYSLKSILIPRCLSQIVLDQANRGTAFSSDSGLECSLGKESYICFVACFFIIIARTRADFFLIL